MTDLTHMARPGARLPVRVIPRASRNAVAVDDDGTIRVHVTVVPEGGKANAAVVKLLSKALGVPKSRLTLVRGETARDKLFQIEP